MDHTQQARELLAQSMRDLGGHPLASEELLSGKHDTFSDRAALAAIAAALRAAPEGYVLVPVKPTPEMLAAVGNGADGLKRRIWRGMLAARPQGVKDAT